MAEPLVARFPAGPRVRAWAQEQGVSEWMAARWMHLAEDPGALLDGIFRRPPRYIRVNTLRAPTEEVKKRLEARGFELEYNDLDPDVLRIRNAPVSPGATYEHMQGMTIPQDLASASAVLALGVRPGDVVADLAAAPGVKTVHIATALRGKGAVVAVEPEPERMRALRFNLERCGVTSAWSRQSRAQDLPGEAWADKVLLDAPCTGEGTIPKDKTRRTGRFEEIARMAMLQADMVDAADRVLKPGGRIVYATCTYGPEENEAQVQRLIDRGYVMEDLSFDVCGRTPLGPGITEWPGHELDPSIAKARRFFAGRHPTLGFFVARLCKPGGPGGAV